MTIESSPNVWFDKFKRFSFESCIQDSFYILQTILSIIVDKFVICNDSSFSCITQEREYDSFVKNKNLDMFMGL